MPDTTARESDMNACVKGASLRESHSATLNNFDIIRLFAALEVALSHMATHLSIENSVVIQALGYFPGVPIFFFISGYLIFQSYSNIQENKYAIFFRNRILRLYPALFFCFLITTLSLYFSGYLASKDFTLKDFAIWAITSLTFFQFYNPDFLRGYGVGAINGSLWTISVELQFYILTPLLFIFYRRHKKASIAVALVFMLINTINTFLNDKSSMVAKLVGVSFAPWLYMFMVGAYVSTSQKIQKSILSVNPLAYLLIYLASYFLAAKYELGTGNGINFVSYIFLCLLVFRLAHAKPTLSRNLLRGNDISYGVYIFHMPIVNLMLFYNLQATRWSLLVCLMATVGIAVISWYFVEKPSLKLKKIALRKYT